MKNLAITTIPLFLISFANLSAQQQATDDYFFYRDGLQLVETGDKWEVDTISIYFANGAQADNDEIRKAFQIWEAVTTIDFVEVTTLPSDDYILVDWGNSDDLKAMTGNDASNTIARTIWETGITSDAHIRFNTDISFTNSTSPSSSEHAIRDVAIHEIGHALGLAHSTDSSAVMYFSFVAGDYKTITDIDINDMGTVYGFSISSVDLDGDQAAISIDNCGCRDYECLLDQPIFSPVSSYTYNIDQSDIDGDGFGDVCDEDRDADGLFNHNDNCPSVYNPDQTDADRDGVGKACDSNDSNSVAYLIPIIKLILD